MSSGSQKQSKKKSKKKKEGMKWQARLAISMLCAAITFVLVYMEMFTSIDSTVYDLLYQHQGSLDRDIRIVAIDDNTISQYGAYEPLTYRKLFTELLNGMADEGLHPKTVSFDMIFDSLDKETDAAFAAAISRHKNVILGTHNSEKTTKENNYLLEPMLVKAAESVGYCDAIVDYDNCIRRTILSNPNLNSLAYQTYLLATGDDGTGLPESIKTDKLCHFEYTAASGGYTVVSMANLLDGTVPYAALKDKVVFVGSYATGLSGSTNDDIYSCPLSSEMFGRSEVFGIEIQANIYQALCKGKVYSEFNVMKSAAVSATLVFAMVFLLLNAGIAASFLLLLAGFATELLFLAFLHTQNMYFSVAAFILMLATMFPVVLILHYVIANRRKKEILGTFKRYISPDVADALVSRGEELSLGGTKRNIACLFVDVRGFTKMSEELKPEEIVDILNGYLGMATEQIFKNGGMLDKFIGDAVMAVFNAPIDQEDYVYKAVCAAYGIVYEGQAIAAEVFRKYGKQLRFGVGVHVGPAVVGNIGCQSRMDYTAIGDTVNTASRLESNAEGNQILISEDVYNALNGRIAVNFVGEKMFKNKKDAIKCYEVRGLQPIEKTTDDSAPRRVNRVYGICKSE